MIRASKTGEVFCIFRVTLDFRVWEGTSCRISPMCLLCEEIQKAKRKEKSSRRSH